MKKTTLLLSMLFSITSLTHARNPITALFDTIFHPRREKFKEKTKQPLNVCIPEEIATPRRSEVQPSTALSEEEELAQKQTETMLLSFHTDASTIPVVQNNPAWDISKNFAHFLIEAFKIQETPQTIGLLNFSTFYKKKTGIINTESLTNEINRSNAHNNFVLRFLVLKVSELNDFNNVKEIHSLINNLLTPWIVFIINDTPAYVGTKKLTIESIENYIFIPNEAEQFARYMVDKEIVIEQNNSHQTPELRQSAFEKISSIISTSMCTSLEQKTLQF